MMRRHSLFVTTSMVLPLSLFMMACGGDQEASAPRVHAAISDQEKEPALAKEETQTAGASFVEGEITVAPGFDISVFHEGVGKRARQLAVRDNGDVLIARLDGKLIGIRDNDGDGIADQIDERNLPVTTAVAIRGDWVYFSDRVSVSRVGLDENLVPAGDITTIIDGFPPERQHADKTFTMDGAGNLYVNSGAPSNACQEKMRTPGSPGAFPCPQLENYAGVWKFDGTKIGQKPADGSLFVTGVRNAVALDWSDKDNGLMLAMHGRDQLSALWPDYYTDAQSAVLPAEEFHFVTEGDNLGWPYTYFNGENNTRYLAPEYGGDGVKVPEEVYNQPLHGFPAHWAPNDLLIVNDDRFPAPFNEGVLIAFHGSWNRAPLPQAGYRVAFVPMEDGKMNGAPIDFAVGFPLKEQIASPGNASHRPMGLAQGPEGAIYVSDSVKGTIWRIMPSAE